MFSGQLCLSGSRIYYSGRKTGKSSSCDIDCVTDKIIDGLLFSTLPVKIGTLKGSSHHAKIIITFVIFRLLKYHKNDERLKSIDRTLLLDQSRRLVHELQQVYDQVLF